MDDSRGTVLVMRRAPMIGVREKAKREGVSVRGQILQLLKEWVEK